LITGAADDDPSGIATYSQTGAQFGYSLGWLMIISYPMMVIVQGISAGIGAVTGAGIAENLRRHYPPWMLRSAVLLLLVANVFNIGADLAAMGAALQLVLGGPHHVYALGFAIVCVLLEVFVTYAKYVKVLRWLTLSLFAYVGVVFIVHLPWGTALSSLVIPTFSLDADFSMAVVAILGTTISPYLFFWQAGEEMEELRRRKKKPLVETPAAAPRELKRIRTDTLVGMAFSNLIALSSYSRPRRRSMSTVSQRLNHLLKRRRLCVLSQGTLRFSCSPRELSARVCSPCRCLPDQQPMPSPRCFAGAKAWINVRERQRHFTA
jgi:NRAMP (natural resistance-associated macrophage protein)-like metal ion transporter